MISTVRIQKEVAELASAPSPGIACFPADGGASLQRLMAEVAGPPGTVYEGGVFHLEVNIPDRYPFEPPHVRFVTSIYHPNIDSGGRICLDILNLKPKSAGENSWAPSLSVRTVLLSVRLLMECPNPDDGLMADITREFKHSRELFDEKARRSTRQHACTTLQAAGADAGAVASAVAAAAPEEAAELQFHQRPSEEEEPAAEEPAAAVDAPTAPPATAGADGDAQPPPKRSRLQLSKPAQTL